MMPNPHIQELVDSVVETVCVELFQAYNVHLTHTSAPQRFDEGIAYCGVVGFAGPYVRGTCLLATTEGPLLASDPVNGATRDWVGELVNQLVGRIKNRVLSRGVEFYVTTPVVIRGQHIAPLPRRDFEPLTFAGASGHVFVWVEVETSEDFMPTSTRSPEDAQSEGEALLF